MFIVRGHASTPFGVGCPDLEDGATVRIQATNGRALLARVARGAGDREDGLSPATVGLDVDQRHELRVHPGDYVDVQVRDLPPITEVSVLPTFAAELATPEQDEVRRVLAERRAPLQLGMPFRAPVGSSGASGIFEVVELSGAGGGEGVVDAGTRILFRTPTLAELAHYAADAAMVDVGGLHQVLPALREAVEVPLTRPALYRELGIVPPRGVLLHGPPGSGKTFVARAIAHELGAGFEYVNGPELVGSTYGKTESNLRTIFNEAARKAPTLLLIDEIDALAPDRGHLGAQADYRMVTQLLALMDGLRRMDGVVVLGTTNRPDSLDPAVRRPGRLDVEIFVGPPDTAEREEVLRVYVNRMPLTDEARSHLPELAAATHGYLPADLMAVARQAGLHALRRHLRGAGNGSCGSPSSSATGLVVDVEDLQRGAADVAPSLLRGAAVRLPAFGFADLVGHDAVRRDLAALAGAERDPRSPGEVFLLTGPSGTGKTALAHAYADALGAHLIQVAPADIFTSWFGESEEAVRSLFQLASFVAPTVVALEHLDGLAPHGPDVGSAARRTVNQLLRELEDLPAGVHVAATVDDAAGVDPAVARRFATTFRLGLPGPDDRRELVRRLRPDLGAEALDAAAAATKGLDFGLVERHARELP